MKAFLVDTLTAILFFTAVAATIELVVVGLEPRQVLVARAITVPVMVLTGRAYGLWRDLVLSRLGPARGLATVAADTLAFLTFQVPVYVATLAIAGATPGQIAAAAGVAVLGMICLARPFGIVLDRVRRLCGTAPLPARSASNRDAPGLYPEECSQTCSER